MENTELTLLEMIGSVYEDLDTDKIEERFVELVNDMFHFDRVALFFLKHRKQVLQGKLSRGFPPGMIENTEIPIKNDSIIARPLITGIPVRISPDDPDQQVGLLGLANSVLVPIVNKKRIPCWEIKNCNQPGCPAYGRKWLRCWLVPGTKCGGEAVDSLDEKAVRCPACPIFASFNIDAIEGVLVADNSISKRPITEDIITLVSVIAHTVGMAINNSKIYMKTLDVAIRDSLTSLHNRRYFNERLLDEVERAGRYGDSLSLIMCDIDHFKRINDNYGHPVGDEVLRWLAEILRKGLRKSDVISRYGGEEFAAILSNASREQALAISEKLRRSIEEYPFVHRESRISVTLSFGISTFGIDSKKFEGLIESADKALYKAKAQGRNMVCTP
ncbi:MAG: GGDEF domain-containing protein [Nitrospiraceae bacterium]|nr:GGDEF domain-containing protein [Nitrospiraceae bacterium]